MYFKNKKVFKIFLCILQIINSLQ
jgi:hypothetical protein